MKELIEQLNKVFENKTRLGIMSALMANSAIDFNSLKSLLGVTDGNLSSNITILENAGYIKVKKKFIGKKTNTSYSSTADGRRAFIDHLNVLESLIKRYS